MKRSDLLNVLKDEIIDIRQDTTYSALEWAETLLSLVENQGMLPPEYTCINIIDPRPSRYGQCRILAWEPEDEKNV